MRVTLSTLAILLAATVCLGLGIELPVQESSSVELRPTTLRDATEIWYQEPTNLGAFMSLVDLGAVVDAECADDLLFYSDTVISAIDWWGARVLEDLSIDHFLVTFYTMSGDCEHPDETAILAERSIFEFSETETGADYYYMYSGAMEPVTLPADVPVWISVRAALLCNPDDPYSGWWWTVAYDEPLCPAMCFSEYWGLDWIALHDYDPGYPGVDGMAFRLYGEVSTAARNENWSGLKRIFGD